MNRQRHVTGSPGKIKKIVPLRLLYSGRYFCFSGSRRKEEFWQFFTAIEAKNLVTGNKLTKTVELDGNAEIGRTDCSANFLYENNDLKAIFTSAGRIVTFDGYGYIIQLFLESFGYRPTFPHSAFRISATTSRSEAEIPPWRDNPQYKLPSSSLTACVASISLLSLRYLCALKDGDGSGITLQLKENGAMNYTSVILPL